MVSNHPIKVVAVTGGKGGVGKTNLSVNLSIALAEMRRRVVLMDADLGLANVDVLLGIQAEYTLADVLDGGKNLRDILVKGPGGIRVVPASSGIQQMAALSPQEHAGLIHAFSDLSDQMDVLWKLKKNKQTDNSNQRCKAINQKRKKKHNITLTEIIE
eukprot:TRINITY_DN109990_c0_g1_i1.p1 TRINITY_DN109990_c0_g1~~TRINITY_DN109990_c0_g1_i1.p1  ORF type:complete len:158 (-),score=8.69 TRINITY_DN109990_c0_g1_i1:8-481(-)